MLKFSKANSKTSALALVPTLQEYLRNKRKVYSLDLLSGFACPGALDCLSKVVEIMGKRTIKDGPQCKFRCFSASQEVVYPNVYNSRKHNFDLLREPKDSMGKFELLNNSMPKDLGICRIHVAGDFFNLAYMMAWATMAEAHPDRLFYAYTKSLPFWLKLRRYISSLPNFVLTASSGGRHDNLIGRHRLREAKVIFTEAEANGLDIDHDDSHAADPTKRKESFCLLLHGIQPKGSEAATALKNLKGKGSYGRGGKK